VCAKLQGELRVRARVSFRILFVFSMQPGGDGSTTNAYCKHGEGRKLGGSTVIASAAQRAKSLGSARKSAGKPPIKLTPGRVKV